MQANRPAKRRATPSNSGYGVTAGASAAAAPRRARPADIARRGPSSAARRRGGRAPGWARARRTRRLRGLAFEPAQSARNSASATPFSSICRCSFAMARNCALSAQPAAFRQLDQPVRASRRPAQAVRPCSFPLPSPFQLFLRDVRVIHCGRDHVAVERRRRSRRRGAHRSPRYHRARGSPTHRQIGDGVPRWNASIAVDRQAASPAKPASTKLPPPELITSAKSALA